MPITAPCLLTNHRTQGGVVLLRAGAEGGTPPSVESHSQVDTGHALPAAYLVQEGGDFTQTAAGARGSERMPRGPPALPLEPHLSGWMRRVHRFLGEHRPVLFWILQVLFWILLLAGEKAPARAFPKQVIQLPRVLLPCFPLNI